MSRNTLRARLEFSFKGETHAIDRIIDLDACGGDDEDAPDFHLHLARAQGIDPYSYLYEVMASHEIAFSEPTGLAAACCRDGQFDWAAFVHARAADAESQAVRAMAAKTMGIADPDSQPELIAALLAAYRAGKAEK